MHSKLEINSQNIIKNIKALKSQISDSTKFIAVVKGNAYGHGIKEIVQISNEYVDGYHVEDLNELISARSYTDKPIYLLGYVSNDEIKKAVNYKPVLGVYSLESLRAINSAASELGVTQKVHIKIDSFVGRMGILETEIDELQKELSMCTNIAVDGVYTHFTTLKDTIDMDHARNQMNHFKQVLNKLNLNQNELVKHISSSAGLFIEEIAKDQFFNAVRVGKALYGVHPSKALEKNPKLFPTLTWKTQIAQIKELSKGFPIGYGASTKLEKNTKIAVLPQGYSDGYDKRLSYESEILVSGKRCKILGKVSMNMIVIDITDVKKVNVGDEAILLGQQNSEEITVRELSEKCSSSECEVLARLSSLLDRKII